MASELIQCRTPCPICGDRFAEPVARRDGKTGKPLLTVQCHTCGTGRIDPLPTPAALQDWYTHQYRQDYKQAERPALRHVLRAGRNARQRWSWLQAALETHGLFLPEAAQTLDIGASSGEFVDLMRRQGYRAMGIEPHAGYAAHARDDLGLSIRHGTLHQHLPDIPDGSLGLISLFHVFEHLVDPVETLDLMHRKLSPQGLLLIEVPNATRFCAPSYLFFRAHTLYFTAHTLRQTLEASGWTVVTHSAPDSDNLLILARPGDRRQAAMAWRNDQGLTAAQRRRRWSAYLVDQLISGRWWLQHQRRREERQSAGAFAGARPLLDALHAPASSLAHPPQGSRTRYRAGLAGGTGFGTALAIACVIDG